MAFPFSLSRSFDDDDDDDDDDGSRNSISSTISRAVFASSRILLRCLAAPALGTTPAGTADDTTLDEEVDDPFEPPEDEDDDDVALEDDDDDAFPPLTLLLIFLSRSVSNAVARFDATPHQAVRIAASGSFAVVVEDGAIFLSTSFSSALLKMVSAR